MKTVKESTIDAVVEGLNGRYGLRYSRGAGNLAVPDTLSEALGYSQFSPVRELSTKRGKWHFFAREKGALPGSAVAFYAANDVAFLDEKVKVGYLFMSKPGRVDVNEMGHNAEVLTPALLEKSPTRSQIVLRGAAVGAVIPVIILESLALFGITPHRFSWWVDRILLDLPSSGLGAIFGGICAYVGTSEYSSTLPQNAAARLSNPEGYIYGRDAAAVIKADLAYSKLLETGASGVTQEAFRAALSVAGVRVPQ